jgi:hypothetical protein
MLSRQRAKARLASIFGLFFSNSTEEIEVLDEVTKGL